MRDFRFVITSSALTAVQGKQLASKVIKCVTIMYMEDTTIRIVYVMDPLYTIIYGARIRLGKCKKVFYFFYACFVAYF